MNILQERIQQKQMDIFNNCCQLELAKNRENVKEVLRLGEKNEALMRQIQTLQDLEKEARESAKEVFKHLGIAREYV